MPSIPTPRTRLVQIFHEQYGRRVALVDPLTKESGGAEALQLLSTYRSIYAFAQAAIETGVELRELISTDLAGIALDYDRVHSIHSGWTFLPSFDHPSQVTRTFISGCANRHGEGARATQRSFVPWFYKGNGMHLRAHGEALSIPASAKSGAEEAEIAAVYLIDEDRIPRRVGFTMGNEFADPALYNFDANAYTHSKLRTCAIGPELVLDAVYDDLKGSVRVERAGQTIWSREIVTGEAHTEFPLAELEQGLFQYEAHRVPGDVHIHYLGGSVSSFAECGSLEDGDAVVIAFDGFGRTLRNTIERKSGRTIHIAAPL